MRGYMGWGGFVVSLGFGILLISIGLGNAEEAINNSELTGAIVLILFGGLAFLLPVISWIWPQIRNKRCPNCHRLARKRLIENEKVSKNEDLYTYECLACGSHWELTVITDSPSDYFS